MGICVHTDIMEHIVAAHIPEIRNQRRNLCFETIEIPIGHNAAVLKHPYNQGFTYLHDLSALSHPRH